MTNNEDNRLFRVEGWGEVGYANLWGFVPHNGYKWQGDLEVGESTEGKFQNPTSDHKPERITRIR